MVRVYYNKNPVILPMNGPKNNLKRLYSVSHLKQHKCIFVERKNDYMFDVMLNLLLDVMLCDMWYVI